MKKTINEDTLVINNIKALALDMIDIANSGHPGIVLSAAPMMYTLFANHLNINPDDDTWVNRDRFIMSAGHGSALLYATLYMAGYKISTEELKNFRQLHSILPGHPEHSITPGVDFTTGPLGQGIASAVGIALAQRYIANLIKTEKKEQTILNHYTYVLCGDGDLMEGVAYEALSFAGTQKLDKLIVLYDSNDVSLDSDTSKTFTEDTQTRFKSMGWHTEYVKDGNNIDEINKAINRAKKTMQPSLIQVKTILGYGSVNQGKNIIHGKPLDKNDLGNLRQNYNISEIPFTISKDAMLHFRNKITARCGTLYNNWQKNINDTYNIGNEYLKNIITALKTGEALPENNFDNLKINLGYQDELRNSNGQIMSIISDKTPLFLGGSADLSSSTKTHLSKETINSKENPTGKNILFGVREHAMGSILNGMATYGLKVFGSTFLTFSDYLKPAIRMSALMDLPVTYIFTHDSVNIGEDGATHQPVEQLASLRSIPNLKVYRPADINEVIGSWENILKENSPAALIISKQKQQVLKTSVAKKVEIGAYVIRMEKEKLDGIIIATGTEVGVAELISEQLALKGIDLRVVSMPCIELFELNGIEYKNLLLPKDVKTITLEASNDFVWYKYATDEKHMLNITDFGYSGKPEDILKKVGFDNNTLLNKVYELLK